MHDHHHHHNKSLNVAFWLNAFFTVVELVGGVYTNSTAILTDALHDFGDTLAIGLGIWLEKVSGKKRSDTFSYGYKRFSLLSALILSAFLLGGAMVMLVKSVGQLFAVQEKVDAQGMLWLSILGIVVNGAAFLNILRSNKKTSTAHEDHSHDHGHEHHDHDHHEEHHHEHAEKPHHNTKAIAMHLLEDTFGWIAVLIGSIIIKFTNWYWIDPLLSVAISIFIIVRAIPMLKSTLTIFLQSVPENFDADKITKEILKISGVKSLHDMHAWTMEGNFHVLTLHVVLADDAFSNRQHIQHEIVAVLKRNNIHHPTVQIEAEEEDCGFRKC